MTLASLERIERRFGDFEVLTGASLRVAAGEAVGIARDRYAAAAAGDDEMSGVEQGTNCCRLEDTLWSRRGDDAAYAAGHRMQHPAAFAL